MRETIIPLKIMLEELGYNVSRIITSTTIRDGVLASNAKMMQRSGGTMVINDGGQLETVDRNLSDINARFIANELPAPETYNLRYKTQSANPRFCRRQVCDALHHRPRYGSGPRRRRHPGD
jgi:hypothetical protein